MKYIPAKNASSYATRVSGVNNEYFYQIIKTLNLNTAGSLLESHKQNFIILGFCCDEGVRRNQGVIGAKEGPEIFRKCFYNLPIHLSDNLCIYDAGNIHCDDGDLEEAQQILAKFIAKIIELNATPIVIGGGHETAWGHLQGLYAKAQYPAIFNFDAHFDLRETLAHSQGTSGTPFYQAHQHLSAHKIPFHYYCAGIQPFANTNTLFDYAHQTKTQYLLAEKINNNPNDLSFIDKVIKAHEQIYVTLCLDVFQAAIAPGVSAPQTFGIQSKFVIESLRKFKRANKIIALDIVELNPTKDIDNRTAKLAAAILAECFHA